MNSSPGKIGVGYGQSEKLSVYRSNWPEKVEPLNEVAVLKVTRLDDTPVAVLFNYPVHPTVLKGQNRQFSADFVGYARKELQSYFGPDFQPIYFNGAQGDINPVIFNEDDRFEACKELGKLLAKAVESIYKDIHTNEKLDLVTKKELYSFKPLPTPFGLKLPLNEYKTEMNVIIVNRVHAFVTIPGELSTIYDRSLKDLGNKLGFRQVSIFGLTNDAHGYIILPDAWRHKTMESGLSFGGEDYGDSVLNRAEKLLREHTPAAENNQ